MKIVVLGGQGFIGHNLCLRLVEEGHDVCIFTNYFDETRKIEGCKYVVGDFSNINEYENMFEDVDTVYHLISTTNPSNSDKNVLSDIEGNLINTVKLLDVCVKKSVNKVIFPSSGGTVYGISDSTPLKEDSNTSPICSYGITKLAIEKYMQLYNKLYGLNYVILRLANPYGPFHVSNNQGFINVVLDKIINEQPIEIWGDGTVARDYVYIDDVTTALYQSLNNSVNNEIINIGSGKATTINELLSIMCSELNIKPSITYKDARSADVPVNVLNIEKAKRVLNWEPTININDGINETYQSIKAHKGVK